jgi:hypothetical protein
LTRSATAASRPESAGSGSVRIGIAIRRFGRFVRAFAGLILGRLVAARDRERSAERVREPDHLFGQHLVDGRRDVGDLEAHIAADDIVEADRTARRRLFDLDRQRPRDRLALQRPERARQAHHFARLGEDDPRVLDAADTLSFVRKFFAETAASLRIEPEIGGIARPAMLLRPPFVGRAEHFPHIFGRRGDLRRMRYGETDVALVDDLGRCRRGDARRREQERAERRFHMHGSFPLRHLHRRRQGG